MSVKTTTLPKRYHEAVLRWRDVFLPDYGFLIENWDKHFPNDQTFELCAYREMGMCTEIECGDMKGKPKSRKASEMQPEQAHHLFGAIRAQASTEFGSIQQHRLTLARAQEEEEQFWILRMMAEELRHGYQMLHLLAEDDWSSVSKDSTSDMIDDILSMNTGSHVLGAFNIDFDSFVDNVVFCALIDRVGKYQLPMQKISAYQPMAESMPQMLREEAFHLAAGVVPMRRWATAAAKGETFVTMEVLQKTLNKWLPRGLEMFGDERGRRHQRPHGPQADEERRGAAAVLQGGREAGARPQPALPARPRREPQPRRFRDLPQPHPGRRDRRGGAPGGPPPHAAHRLLPPPRRPRLPHGRLPGRDLHLRPRLPPAPGRAPSPSPTSPSRDYKDYVEALLEVEDGTMTIEQAATPDAGPAPRRRRLPVLEVGALGGRRAGRDRPASAAAAQPVA